MNKCLTKKGEVGVVGWDWGWGEGIAFVVLVGTHIDRGGGKGRGLYMWVQLSNKWLLRTTMTMGRGLCVCDVCG